MLARVVEVELAGEKRFSWQVNFNRRIERLAQCVNREIEGR